MAQLCSLKKWGWMIPLIWKVGGNLGMEQFAEQSGENRILPLVLRLEAETNRSQRFTGEAGCDSLSKYIKS